MLTPIRRAEILRRLEELAKECSEGESGKFTFVHAAGVVSNLPLEVIPLVLSLAAVTTTDVTPAHLDPPDTIQ